MAEQKLSLHVRMFNDKVRVMNQTQNKNLTLSAQEARDLHADIFAILAQVAELSETKDQVEEIVQISMDGGSFK